MDFGGCDAVNITWSPVKARSDANDWSFEIISKSVFYFRGVQRSVASRTFRTPFSPACSIAATPLDRGISVVDQIFDIDRTR